MMRLPALSAKLDSGRPRLDDPPAGIGRRARLLAVAALAAAAVLAAGCGGGGGATTSATTGGGGGGQALTTVKIGGIAIPHFAPIVLGAKKGFFRQEGIKLEIHYAAGGAAIVPGVISGDFDVGYGNAISTILARGKGLPIKMIAPADVGPSDPDGPDSGGLLVVKKDSPIHSLKDLDGHTIASNTLDNIQTLTTRAAADKRGGDSSTFKFLEVEFPDMFAALDAGRVDAIATVEPFWTVAKEKGGYRLVAYVNPIVQPDAPNDEFFTSERFLNEHRDVAESFARAVRKSLDYANSHKAEVRKIVPTFTKITPELAHKIVMPEWSTGPIGTKGLALFERLIVRYGLAQKDQVPPISELVDDLTAKQSG